MNEKVIKTETAAIAPAGKKSSAKKTEKTPIEYSEGVFSREIFNREQAKIFTTLSVEVLDKAVDRGDLVSHSAGARVLFLREELIEYIRRCPAKPQKQK
jgi:hypothetical protein